VPEDIPFLWGHSWGVGARSIGMGGAFSAVSDDYASLYYNPAGMGQIKKTAFQATFSNFMIDYKYNSSLEHVEKNTSSDYSKLNDIGLSLPVPVSRGSLVFSFGYHRVRQFDSNMMLGNFVKTNGYETTWQNQLSKKGALSNTSLGGAVEISPGLLLGAGVHIWGGDRDYTRQFVGPRNVNIFYDSTSTDHISSEFSGVNFSFGTLMKVNDRLRVGIAFVSPVELRAKESWDWSDTYTAMEKDTFLVDSLVSDSGNDEYKIQCPWIIRGGIAGNIGPVLLSGDVELVNYSQIQYTTEPPSDSWNKTQANLAIQNNFKNALNYRFGAEITLPFLDGKIRGGYAYYPSPFKDAPSKQNRTVYSIGAGAKFLNQWALDVAYSFTDWELPTSDQYVQEKIGAKNFLFSFTYFM
jgi:long-subunit fatty acid transport protein